MFNRQFRVYEHLHIPFWLVKDSCWALELRLLGVSMIIPTLGIAILICIKTRKNWTELLPNMAIALWISANSIWMCDEFFNLEIKELCYAPFALGLVLIAIWLVKYFPAVWKNGKEEPQSKP
jgi:H+/Cl- antiporter ClcA